MQGIEDMTKNTHDQTQKGDPMRDKLRAALCWLRGFMEGMMAAHSYDESTFQRQIRDLVGEVEEDEQAPHPDH